MTSRRRADELIAAGRVTLNDEPVPAPGTTAMWGEDRICVDGKEIPGPAHPVYLMLNKPFGVISALKDPQGRPVVTDLLRGVDERVYPVGRLDFDSLGLLLLTNDGEWAHRLTHPRYRVPRTYKVAVEGTISPGDIERIRTGVPLEDGFSGSAGVTLLQKKAGRSLLRMTIHAGRRRLARRTFEAAGYPVVQLIRIGFGPLVLGDLKVGSYRHLSEDEVAAARRSVGLW
ncbi:MAG: rRNA pseudouridine synthase [Deltaproteobacteria bacterium]|nr:rRNA pseudouridine synthase [Deltaproteobacteria bacterium]